jgi:hypothetical protein
VPLDDPAAHVDAQRVLDRLFLEEVERDGIGDLVVPAKAQPVVVVAVVRMTFPVAGKADAVRRLLEAAVAQKLGGQPAFDAFVHELEELPVEPGVDPALDLRGVDDDAGLVRLSVGARDGAGEDQPCGSAACPEARQVTPDQGCLRTENA